VYFASDVPPRIIPRHFLAIIQVSHLLIYSSILFYWLSRNKGYSNGALKRYTWQNKVAWAFMSYSLSFLLYYVLVWTGLLKVEYDYVISLASSFFIYFIGYHGFQKQEVLKMNEGRNYDKSSLSPSASHSIMKKLKALMEDEKPYLKNSLRLNDIADQLQILPHHISQVINEIEEKNFSDYINKYRIEEAKKLLIESNYKVLHVAFDSGFNNKASFNNAFKKTTGVTPSKYRESSMEHYSNE
ncbi:MAG: helix-turn-helix transcriptional regulator, partial [Ekhidna sp.]